MAIVGGGVAGLTAALRLAERGYRVTVFEQKAYLGGQFGAHTHARGEELPFVHGETARAGLYHEHCYHMFLNWYHNFWRLAADLGLDRDRDFEPRHSIKHLHRGEYPRMREFTNPGAISSTWKNLFSGVEAAPDVFLHAYSLIDLLSQAFRSDSLLDRYTVAGFMRSRPYASEGSAALHERTLAKAFANPSYLTSASSYQRFVNYGLRDPTPMLWVLRGNTQQRLFEPLERVLERRRCTVHKGRRVADVLYTEETGTFRVVSAAAERDLPHPAAVPRRRVGERVDGPYDYVILAVPPVALQRLVGSGLAPVRKLQTNPMASMDIYFKRRLVGIPKEHVVLHQSKYGLTFIDNSQLWPGLKGTVLNVVATDFEPLADLSGEEAAANRIIHELSRFIPRPYLRYDDVAYWHIQTNLGDELFLNEVGSEQWRPVAQTEIPSLFLAGDYCRTFIDVVSLEGAVVSGIEAAQAVQAQARRDAADAGRADDPRWRPIDLVRPPAYPRAALAGLKLGLAPLVPAAKAWSWMEENRRRFRPGGPPPASEDLMQHAEWLLGTPYRYAADLWQTALGMWSAPFDRRSGTR